ncbi:MAG: Mth938-like domain-containing protein [Rhizobiaceae bacterium]|nr:Mth938-like domain-containing protein [Rhizobiaceae bacterium]
MGAGIQIREAHFPGRAPIDAYGNGGFRFADMSHRGSLLCLPSGIHGWDAVSAGELTPAHFAKVMTDAADIGILLIGTGADMLRLPKQLRETLSEAGIAADSMSTGAAVRTYNVLLAEDRAVAAALIAVE